ncbi:MAG: ABC transporter substrate-binding protein [Anaerolineaceae bacterium]|nr:ABC transporter substrate-binding protein [Anaerolineaceae bacterium]
MKSYTKLTILMIVAAFAASLFGCSAQPAATQPTATVASQVEPTQPAPTTAPEVKPTVPPAPTETSAPKAVTLTYANWNLGTEAENNIQRQMIKAYTDVHPNVTVKLVDMSDPNKQGWDGLLTAYAAKGALPDVFMANNVPLYVQNGWLADLTDITKNDADWKFIPKPLQDAFTYSGKILALPAGQFIMGYFVNQDLYDAANLTAPEYGVSVDDFFKVAKSLTNVPKGILGLDEQFPIEGWYPSTQDSNLKYYSFDGTKMNYNSAAFKAAVAKTTEMIPYTWQGLTPEKQKNFKSKGPWEMFANQEVGVRWDASWAIGDLVKNAKFNWDFVGIPGGNQCIVFDAMVVSKTAPDVQEAYNFAKWMTFSTESYKKQAELAKALGSAPNLPIAVDPASLALFKTFVDKPGVNKALDNLDKSLLESLAKVVPGYINARWEGKPGIDIGTDKDVNIGYMLDNAPSGKFKFEDYSAKLEEFANKIMTDASAAVNK